MVRLADKISQVRAQWDRYSVRERRLISSLIGLGVAMVTLLLGYFVWSGLTDMEDHNAAARQALKDIAEHREEFVEARRRMQSQEVRVSRTPVQPSSLLDAAAKEAGIAQIDEQTDRPPAPRGKKYVEKGTDLKIRRVDLLALAKFLRKLESGPNLVVSDRLLVRARYNEHDQLDVEIGVMTFERAPEAPRKPGAAAGKADKT